jgi:hypothetical protein
VVGIKTKNNSPLKIVIQRCLCSGSRKIAFPDLRRSMTVGGKRPGDF